MKSICIIFLLTSLLFSCKFGCAESNKYELRNTKVFFIGCTGFDGSSSYEQELFNADAKTFTTIYIKNDLVLGKDKYHVYYKSSSLSSADPSTFEYLENLFCTDKDSIYYLSLINEDLISIPGALKKSFKVDKIAPWARDEKRAYWQDRSFEISDINRFKAISRTWANDGMNYYYCGQIIDSLDYDSFSIINEFEAKDKTHTYKYGRIVK